MQVSLRDVARRVGVSAPAVYRHFASKEALLGAACDQGFQVFARYLVRALREPTPLARMRASSLQYCAFGLENPMDYRFIFMSSAAEASPSGVHARRAGNSGEPDPTFQFLVDRVTECMGAKIFRKSDPIETAVIIWSHVHGLVSLRLSGHLLQVGSDAAFIAFFLRSSNQLLASLAS